MYIIVYFNGEELKSELKLNTVLKIAKENPNVYQIVRTNRNRDLVWERESN